MRFLIIGSILFVVVIGILIFIKRSIPYDDSDELMTTNIPIDSIWSFGPTTAIYDKTSEKYYWLKSYTSIDQSSMDTLKLKKARIKYMKFFAGPLENRIYQLKVDSIIVFDQVVENSKPK